MSNLHERFDRIRRQAANRPASAHPQTRHTFVRPEPREGRGIRRPISAQVRGHTSRMAGSTRGLYNPQSSNRRQMSATTHNGAAFAKSLLPRLHIEDPNSTPSGRAGKAGDGLTRSQRILHRPTSASTFALSHNGHASSTAPLSPGLYRMGEEDRRGKYSISVSPGCADFGTVPARAGMVHRVTLTLRNAGHSFLRWYILPFAHAPEGNSVCCPEGGSGRARPIAPGLSVEVAVELLVRDTTSPLPPWPLKLKTQSEVRNLPVLARWGPPGNVARGTGEALPPLSQGAGSNALVLRNFLTTSERMSSPCRLYPAVLDGIRRCTGSCFWERGPQLAAEAPITITMMTTTTLARILLTR